MKSQSSLDLISILAELPFEPPKGYFYEITEHKRNVAAIWLTGGPKYLHLENKCARTIHSFYNYKKKVWYAPVNSKKMGAEVAPESIRSWTAMPLNLNPLMSAFAA